MITDEQRAKLQQAREVEKQRVELCLWAQENRVVDLLPEPWSSLLEWDDENKPMVSISYPSALYPQDVVVMTDREVRDYVMWVASMTQMQREHNKMHHADEDDDDS